MGARVESNHNRCCKGFAWSRPHRTPDCLPVVGTYHDVFYEPDWEATNAGKSICGRATDETLARAALAARRRGTYSRPRLGPGSSRRPAPGVRPRRRGRRGGRTKPNAEVRLSVKKMLLPVGVPAYQNYQRMRSMMVIVCVKNVF